jgi:serine/threonine-protein kinase HipA
MDEFGTWRLAPAYDLTYARGLGPTRAHQMSLGGKTGRFVREDLLALGKTMGLRKGGAALLEGVIAALREWERFAAEAGVHANRVRFIASEFRLV